MNGRLLDTILENSYLPMYGITFVISLITYRKYYETPLKYFPILLLYTFFNELLGTIIADSAKFDLLFKDEYLQYNVIIYNIYNAIFYLYFFYVFWNYLHDSRHRKWVVYGSVLFLVVCAVNPFLQNFILAPQMYAYTVGGVVLIFCIILYFIELLDSEKVLYIWEDLLFWISTGLLLFYVGYIPIKITRYFFAVEGVDVFSALRRVQLILIIAMYLCFIIGFLWAKRKSRD